MRPASAEAFDPQKRITQYVWETWGVDDGLPVNGIASIAQTPDGYLWLATTAEYLVRFDGVRFKAFELHADGASELTSLAVDADGVLWVGTDAGLLKWQDGTTIARYDKRAGLLDDNVRCVVHDRNRTVWVNRVREQAIALGQRRQHTIPQSCEAAAVCADPDNTVTVLHHRADHLIGQALSGSERGDRTIAKTRQHLGADVRREVYLIFKEALTNIVRHARARHVDVRMSRTGRQLSIVVDDDGIGFEPRSAGDGCGLQSMMRRAVSVRGTLAVQSSSGRGTTVILTAPI